MVSQWVKHTSNEPHLLNGTAWLSSVICPTAREWGKLAHQPHGLILICLNWSWEVKTIALKCNGWSHKAEDCNSCCQQTSRLCCTQFWL